MNIVAEKLTGKLHRVVNRRRRCRAGSILKANTIERNASVHDEFQAIAIELRRVRALIVDAGRKTHHRDGNFVLEPCVVNALTRPLEVVHIVQSIEVTDRAHTMLLEHISMKLDHIGALRLEANDIYTARKRLTVMKDNYDGFSIAEADLAARGPGDFLASNSNDIRQSGGLKFKFADLCGDASILAHATEDANSILTQSPTLDEYPALSEAISKLGAGKNTD